MKDTNRLSRRDFLKVGGLAGAGAVLPIGRSRTGVILKSLIPDDDIIPGVSYWLPSTCGECYAGCGVTVRTREGNAVKIEGNPANPINRGGLCARGQSALQALYSPARIRSPLRRTGNGTLESVGWPDATSTIADRLRGPVPEPHGRVAIITRQITGNMHSIVEEHAAKHLGARVIVSEPLEYAAPAAANKLCFGIDAVPTYQSENARTIVSFGADFLETWLSPVSNANGYARSHRPAGGTMGRLIQFESHLSLTGANADERHCVAPGAETLIALSIASLMLDDGTLPAGQLNAWREALKPFTIAQASAASGLAPETIRHVAVRLRAEGPSLALAGGATGRSTHATMLQVAVNLINVLSGAYGKTVTFDRVENVPLGTYADMLGLVEDMEAGRIGALIVHDTNPEFTFPQPERLKNALRRVPLAIRLATIRDASTERYDVILPIHHWLERWDQLEPRSGLHCLQQPTIAPWCDSRHPGQVLLDVLGIVAGDPQDKAPVYEQMLHDQWEQVFRQTPDPDDFEEFWKTVLYDGGYWADPIPKTVALNPRAAAIIHNSAFAAPKPEERMMLPITTVRFGDGRQTDRTWLCEMPDPVTMVVWDAPALISPATAQEWKCRSGDIVRLECAGDTITAPVYVQPGTNDAIVAFPLGVPGEDFAAYRYDTARHPLHRLSSEIDRESGALAWAGTMVAFKGIVGRMPIARTQGGDRQDRRGIARTVSLADIGKPSAKRQYGPPIVEHDLYPKHEHPVHDWSMAIDLSACIGCGACMVGCQAENTVPVVGKQQCLIGRELSWLRIERFLDHDRVVFLPMLCQHCEHAPCETVCPVYAAVHSSEGLNQQVYNRCVGTRYCANNCPYKVRRFNWYTYKAEPPLDKQFNPDISIRTRGIMEKCTFCIQRIREHEHIAKDEKRALRDGEIVPACAQSCPTGAITFGDLNDPTSRVSQLFGDSRGYCIFAELNTQPSIVYLQRVYHADGTWLTSI